jgi:hypothetical protein
VKHLAVDAASNVRCAGIIQSSAAGISILNHQDTKDGEAKNGIAAAGVADTVSSNS